MKTARNFPPPIDGKQGFTMTEMLVVMAIITAMMAVAVPNFINWIPNHRLKKAAGDLYGNLQLAKLTAVRNGFNCTVVFSGTGYTAFEDENNNLTADAGEDTVFSVTWQDYKSGVALDTGRGGAGFPTSDKSVVAFQRNGLPVNADGSPGAGNVFLKNNFNKTASITLTAAGTIKVEKLE